MGVEKIKRPMAFTAGARMLPSTGDQGYRIAVERLTSTNTGDILNAEGLTYIVSGSTAGDNVFILPAPSAVGMQKTITVDVNTTDAVDIVGATTLQTFFGSTANAIRFSTGAVRPKHARLTSVTTAVAGGWAVDILTTGVSIIGTTVTTG